MHNYLKFDINKIIGCDNRVEWLAEICWLFDTVSKSVGLVWGKESGRLSVPPDSLIPLNPGISLMLTSDIEECR